MIQIKDEHIKQAQDIFIDGNKFDDVVNKIVNDDDMNEKRKEYYNNNYD